MNGVRGQSGYINKKKKGILASTICFVLFCFFILFLMWVH